MEESFSLNPIKRILGIDYGKRYVGVAISDPLMLTAQGLEIIERSKPNKQRRTLARLAEICMQYDVEEIVIGYPLNMDGGSNERCELTKEFADLLYARTHIRTYLLDERLTTQSSQRALDLLGKKDTKAYIDEMSAMMILQSFLDGKAMGNTPKAYKE